MSRRTTEPELPLPERRHLPAVIIRYTTVAQMSQVERAAADRHYGHAWEDDLDFVIRAERGADLAWIKYADRPAECPLPGGRESVYLFHHA